MDLRGPTFSKNISSHNSDLTSYCNKYYDMRRTRPGPTRPAVPTRSGRMQEYGERQRQDIADDRKKECDESSRGEQMTGTQWTGTGLALRNVKWTEQAAEAKSILVSRFDLSSRRTPLQEKRHDLLRYIFFLSQNPLEKFERNRDLNGVLCHSLKQWLNIGRGILNCKDFDFWPLAYVPFTTELGGVTEELGSRHFALS